MLGQFVFVGTLFICWDALCVFVGTGCICLDSLYLLGHDRRLYLLGQLVFVGTFFAYLLGQFVFVGTKSLILRDLLGHGCGIVGTENPGGAFLYVISFRQNICWDSLYLLGHFVFVGTKNFVFASATKL